MIIRSGFISNSSSSSFIVIGNSGKFDKIDPYALYNGEVNLLTYGDEYEFGWGPQKLDDVASRIAWCMLQLNGGYTDHDENYEPLTTCLHGDPQLRKMLEEVILQEVGYPLVWKLPISSYIDHASMKHENEENFRMFNNKKMLRKFIFDHDSYIQLDNDNR